MPLRCNMTKAVRAEATAESQRTFSLAHVERGVEFSGSCEHGGQEAEDGDKGQGLTRAAISQRTAQMAVGWHLGEDVCFGASVLPEPDVTNL